MSEEKGKFDIAVKISDDYYKAYLSIEFNSNASVKSEEIIKLLKDKNIIFGLKYNIIEEVCKNSKTVFNELIAEGLPHENGLDAKIDFTVSKEHRAKPQLLEDGRVDFKNMGFVEAVKAGDVLAIKTPATKGKNGTTVTGKVIRAKDGKEAVFKIGKNMRLSADGLQAIAEVDGTILFDNDKISVIQMLEIKGDVGVETGNINFQGQVIINGNVTSGYSIECDGDLVINGVVEGATLRTNGSLVISRGIQGHDNANIYCEGNLTSNFINSATVFSRGDIETGAIMNSIVKSDGKITVKGKKGLIVGGDITSKSDIEANVVGSEMGIITSIKLGVDIEVIEELKALTTEVKEKMEMHDKLDKSIKLLKVKVSQNPEDERSLFMLNKYGVSFTELDEQLNEKRMRLKMLNELVNNIRGAQLKARTIYPGTRVKIGSTSYYVKYEMTHTIITKDRGEIVAIGF
ncbi:MAG: FapA family protein [Firmicutes bacterium]|nr:FapA family protein [Bacillota bacterium]